MSDETFNLELPSAPDNWSCTVHVQVGQGNEQRSLASYRIDNLSNEIADNYAQEVVGAIQAMVKNYAGMKEAGTLPKPGRKG